ncbi:hypothetical protein PPEP_a2905 [Pseudoalteromonas peptidolytica F12-50-A1]|uniref:Uncharacterized protein n=1 Tax=Pseudoalteromonas peptidolytica F12-50-A1 TaxID=1315280 RepID=A0A8I0T3X0_9GAMM|nr:hypothetical protein [Pseudoalteromonas peptidolytica F12-50-A1]
MRKTQATTVTSGKNIKNQGQKFLYQGVGFIVAHMAIKLADILP